MKFFRTRNFVIAGLICLALGGISLTTSYLMGGIKLQNGQLTLSAEKSVKKTENLSSNIDKLTINADAVQVKVQLGEEFSVQSELPSWLTLQTKITGNAVSLETHSQRQSFNLNLFNQLSRELIITLPKSDQLKSLNIESDAASTSLSDLKLDSLVVTADASPVKLSNLETKQLTASADAGFFTMNKVSAQKLDFKGNAASLNFNQLSLENSGKISLDAGSLTLSQAQFPGLNVTGDAASLSVNGKSEKLPFSQGDGTVKISVNAGSVKIN